MANADRPGDWSGQPRGGWRFFGRELKRRREAAGVSQDELGKRVFCSGSYIGQFEAGIRRPKPDFAKRIDVELGADGYFANLYEELIAESVYARYFVEAAYCERLATGFHIYAPDFVPGLVQTAAYARAVFRSGFPFIADERIESRVADRVARQRLLDHPTKPLLRMVLDESVIRRLVGGPAVMREQLLHVAALVRRRRIGVQVLPFSAGAPALGGALKLMTFEDTAPMAYTEGAMSGGLLEDPAVVTRLETAYALVRAAALPSEASLALIESVAEEYADGSGG